jgi:NAD dependent epimerase/dehydratase
MKKVLVTGADGFIGSHLVETLVRRGYEVRALALYNSFNDWGWLETIKDLKKVEVVCGDVRDSKFCLKMTKDIDTVFHLAALIAIPYSYDAPESYVDTNVKGTLNICEAAMTNNVRRVLHTSTSEVYGTALYVPIDEKHKMQPQSPYSASKIAADAMAMSYFNSFELPLTIVRPFNTYGPRQSARAVIPTIISQLLKGQTTIKLGALSPTRDFSFVQDTADGFLAIAESDETIGKTLNLGSNFEISVGDTVKLISKVMNKNIEIACDEERMRPVGSEVNRLFADNSLVKSCTNWKPQFGGVEGFEKGLALTIDWFSNPENLRRYKTDIYNV